MAKTKSVAKKIQVRKSKHSKIEKQADSGNAFREKVMASLPKNSEAGGPCVKAFERIHSALAKDDKTRLAHELELLKKAVEKCPKNCGCYDAERLTVIFSKTGKFLGELLTKAGKFANLFLSTAGDEVLGERVASWQLTGLPKSKESGTPTMLRDADFLDAFAAWCDENGCRIVALLEPQIGLWNKVQNLPLPEPDMLTVVERLVVLPLDLAHEAIDGWLDWAETARV